MPLEPSGNGELTQTGWDKLKTLLERLDQPNRSNKDIAADLGVSITALTTLKREQIKYHIQIHTLESIYKKWDMLPPVAGVDYTRLFRKQEARIKRRENILSLPYKLYCFHGREQELQTLRAGFEEGKRRQSISALGGMGKTQLALKYALLFGNTYTRVLWVHAEMRPSIRARYAEIARLLGLIKNSAQEEERAVQATRRWLENNDGWLLILDNADTLHLLDDYLPRNPRGHILLTTRAHDPAAVGMDATLRLKTLSEAASVAFFLDRCDRQDANAEERSAAAALARELGCLPLAMAHAAAYIAHRQTDFAHYLELYQERTLALLDDPTVPHGANHPPSVRATWELNLQAIEADRKREENRADGQAGAYVHDLLNFAAFLPPDDISCELILRAAEAYCRPLSELVLAAAQSPDDTGHPNHQARSEGGTRASHGAGQQAVYHDLLQPLVRYSLVTKNVSSPPRFSIHRMVQLVIADRLGDAKREWQERVVRGVDAAFPVLLVENWRLCERLLPHTRAVGDMARKEEIVTREAGSLLCNLGEYLNAQGRHDEASSYAQAALDIRQRFAAEHPSAEHSSDLAESLHSLGNIRQHQGRFTEAEALYERVLELRQQEQPRSDREILHVLNDKAALYNSQECWQQAEAAYAQLADAAEAVFAGDANLANFYHNRGWSYYGQGRYEEAARWYRLALASWNKSAVKHDLRSADSWHDLAQSCRKLGRAEAEGYYLRALNIQDKAHPDGHYKTAVTLFNIGLLYQNTDRHSQAETYFLQALAMDIKVFGEIYSPVKDDLKALANLYRLMGRQEEAEEMQWQARDIARQLGEDAAPPNA